MPKSTEDDNNKIKEMDEDGKFDKIKEKLKKLKSDKTKEVDNTKDLPETEKGDKGRE